MKSDFLKLNLNDLLRGILVAVITALIAYLYGSFEAGTLEQLNWKEMLLAGAGAGIAYLAKNLLTNSDGEIMKSEESTI